jgi:hypothetical protein
VIPTPGIKAFALSVTVPLNVALDWLNNGVQVARQTTATTILNTVLIAIAPVLNVCVDVFKVAGKFVPIKYRLDAGVN